MQQQIGKALTSLEYVTAEKLAQSVADRVRTECIETDILRRESLVTLFRVKRLVQDNEQALAALDEAITICSALGLRPDKRPWLHSLWTLRAEFLTEIGRPDAAIAQWEQFLAESRGDGLAHTRIQLGMAQTYISCRRTTEYTQCMQAAYQEARALPQEAAEQLGNLFLEAALAEGRAGRFTSAAGLLQSAVDYLGSMGEGKPMKPAHALRIEEAQLRVADFLERAGFFERADSKRLQVLEAATARLGSDDAHVIMIRKVTALAMAQHTLKPFEFAERLLSLNASSAQRTGKLSQLVEARLDLSETYRLRGKYVDAITQLRLAYLKLRDHDEPTDKVQVLYAVARLFTDCGDPHRAGQILDLAFSDAEKIQGHQGTRLQAWLSASKAKLLSSEEPQEAREALQKSYDLLAELPPSADNISKVELRLVRLSLDNEDVQVNDIPGSIAVRLDEISKEFGETHAHHRAALVYRKAQCLIERADLDTAAAELRGAKELLEQRGSKGTVLYAAVLATLADILPDEQPEATEYRSIANNLYREARAALATWDINDRSGF
jgi:tetratricopeptide (TPR) repeat protein